MNSIDIYNQMERLHGAIDDLYDSIDPTTKIASDNYLRADDEYQTLHKMLEEHFKEKRSLVAEAFMKANEDYEKGLL